MIITSFTLLCISAKLVADIVVSIHNYDEPTSPSGCPIAPSVLSLHHVSFSPFLGPWSLQGRECRQLRRGTAPAQTPALLPSGGSSGQITPLILPMAVAIPTPVERTDVGYT